MSRSEQMSRIRGTNTKPEVVLRSALWQAGLRYRLGIAVAGIRPDLVFPKQRVAVFVDGCFWHGCPLHYTRPRASAAFWEAKLRSNVERDARQTNLLESHGWRVVRVWEHEVWWNLKVATRLVQRVVSSGAWHPGPNWRVICIAPVDEGVAGSELEQATLCHLRAPDRTRLVIRKRSAAGGSQLRRSGKRRS